MTTAATPEAVARLAERLREARIGQVEAGASLAELTGYRVGGKAALLVEPDRKEAVADTLRMVAQSGLPWTVIGWGRNLIAADAGYTGVVVKLGVGLRYVRIPEALPPEGERVRVVVGGATMNNHLVRDLHAAGLSGAEFLALVPGTFGGAVVMNAGTKSGEIGDIIDTVSLVDVRGQRRELDAEALRFRYRGCQLPTGSVVVEGRVWARVGGVEEGRERVRKERDYRNRTQPYHLPSAGSVFENPPGDYAGRLIEASGLKGHRVGGACISPLHANFIVTDVGAKAADILELMVLARETVRQTFGVTLKPEQRLVGFDQASVESLLDQLAAERGLRTVESEGGEARADGDVGESEGNQS